MIAVVLNSPFNFGAPPAPPPGGIPTVDLQLWLVADEITGLADGDPLSTWADDSGNGRDATQSGGKRPTYQTNEINGLPVVRFDGVDDEMAIGSVIGSTSDWTAFFVLRASSTSLNQVQYVLGASGSGGIIYGGSLSPFNGFAVYYGGSASIRSSHTPNTSAHVLSVRRSSGTLFFFVDGAAAGSSSETASGNSSLVWSNAVIGDRPGFNFGFPGDIAEILIYSTAATVGDRESIEDTLGSKYNIAITH
jgi:hypothetical protein